MGIPQLPIHRKAHVWYSYHQHCYFKLRDQTYTDLSFFGYKLTLATLLMTWPIDITWTWSLETFSEVNAPSLLEAIRVVVHILQYDSVSSSLRMIQEGVRLPTTFTSEEWWRYTWDRMVCIVPKGIPWNINTITWSSNCASFLPSIIDYGTLSHDLRPHFGIRNVVHHGRLTWYYI